MLSSFFADRGDVYFFNLDAILPFHNAVLAGKYHIVQRHPYASPPSTALFAGVDHKPLCLHCSSQHSIDNPSNPVRSFLPSDTRALHIQTHGPESVIRSAKIIFEDGYRDIDHITLHEPRHQGENDTDDEACFQAGLRIRWDVDRYSDPLSFPGSSQQPSDQFMAHLMSDQKSLRRTGSTIRFGFVIDHECTAAVGRSRDDKYGFQFAQVELAVQTPGSGDSDSAYTYTREVFIAIKDQGGGPHPMDASALWQKLDQDIVRWHAHEDSSYSIRLLLKRRYRAPMMFTSPPASGTTSPVAGALQSPRPRHPLPPTTFIRPSSTQAPPLGGLSWNASLPSALQNHPGLMELCMREGDFDAGSLEEWLARSASLAETNLLYLFTTLRQDFWHLYAQPQGGDWLSYTYTDWCTKNLDDATTYVLSRWFDLICL
ncbi:MAG: hypothetical protein M1818_003408 [Claussenomyces sp. TS43310]|nr:MAG: hypothetical protein M1818_003408 [Claussenomyces sp. TS43310]